MQILRMMICLFMINGTFVLKPIYAQEHWGKEDSIKPVSYTHLTLPTT